MFVEGPAGAAFSTTADDARRKFHGLDVLRGVAALAVVLFHANGDLNLPWLMPSGFMAVDLFFAMSGFVIAYAYDKRIPALGAYGFMRLRAIRFYPLYLLGLGLGVFRAIILLWLGTPELTYTWIAILFMAALVFFPAPALESVHDSISPLNGPAWSLILEMWINAAYSVMFRYITPIVLLSIVIVSAIVLAAFTATGSQIGGGPHWGDLPLGIARVCYSFPLGVLLYRHRDKLPDTKRLGVVLVAVTVICFMSRSNTYYNLAFILVLSPVIVAVGSQAAFNVNVSAYLGVSSYCIYAIHDPLLMLSAGMANRFHFPVEIMVLLAIVAILVAAPILDRFYDRPVRAVLSSLQWNGGRSPAV